MTEDPVPESGSAAKTTVAIQTVGCKLNQAESETLSRRFLRAGYKLVAPENNPHVYVLNTCTVTHVADRKCRQYLRAFKEKHPQSLVVAAGCYVERDADAVKVDGVDLIVGNNSKHLLVEMVEKVLHHPPGCANHYVFRQGQAPFRTRSMIAVQHGCSHGCTYCIVPYVRKPEGSVPAAEVISRIKARESDGYREIVITGTRIGRYRDKGGLEGLLRLILKETAIPRIRLSSLHPEEITGSLVDLWQAEGRICRHLHMALQSGCDTVLKRMARGYTTAEYLSAVNSIRFAMPEIAVTTDVIVGFPGETEGEFEESYRFCRDTGFANMHVFPYSARRGTPASSMPNAVSAIVKKERGKRMRTLAAQNADAFRARFFQKPMVVLWEEQKKSDVWIGYTDNYIKVFTTTNAYLHNCLLDTRLGRPYQQGVWGEINLPAKSAAPPVKGV